MKKILLFTLVIFFTINLFAKDKEYDKNNKRRLKSASVTAGQTTSDYYTWSDVTYTWTDISGTGTELVPGINDDDEYYGPFNIGFSFPFYGNSHSQFYFGSNGTIYFEDDYLDYDYISIPGDPGDGIVEFIAWHWGDLGMYSVSSAAVYLQQFAEYTIIQFDNYSDYDYVTKVADAQVVLYKNGNIEVRYKSAIPSDYTDYYAVGIQRDDTEGLEVVYEDSDFFSSLPRSILFVNTENAELVPFSIYSVLAVFALIGIVTIFRFRKRIFNIA